MAIGSLTLDELSDVSLTKEVPDFLVHIYILKYKILAGVSGIAPDDTGWQHVVISGDVSQSNVCHGHMRVCWALFNYGVEERTSWVKPAWLMLLLRADIDRP